MLRLDKKTRDMSLLVALHSVSSMSRIVLGYGMCHGYRITEIPREMLEELATRYPLDIQDGSSPEYQDLFITIAVHAELQRRSKGGQQDQHVPTHLRR